MAAFDLDWMISVDDHILEPPNVWQDRVAKKYRDAAPRFVRDDKGEAWVYEGRRMPTPGLSAVAGKGVEDFSPLPITYEDMRPGCYDAQARVADMDRSGVAASLCFPSLPGFCAETFFKSKDHDLALECVKVYNDWHLDEWCASAPGRFIPLILIPMWDVAAAAKEIERCAKKGARAVSFSEDPGRLGLPTIQNPEHHWEPMLQAAADNDLVVCTHIGTSGTMVKTNPESTLMVTLSWGAGSCMSAAMLDWLFSGVFMRIPNLKLALSEGGIGWMPYFLERAEQVYAKQRFWAAKSDWTIDLATGKLIQNEARTMPSEFDVRGLFRKHIFGCFIDDVHGIKNIQDIGVDNVMIETDYPHSDSTWPNCLKAARDQLTGLSEEDTYKVLRGNAERLFRFEAKVDGRPNA
jgi:predicted TIM-barrel fold metal-dependent hydrolase